MIRLITTDIDGTLLPYGRWEADEELFPLVRRLREKGILFGAASGRQYDNLRRLFAPVAQDMLFICENGAAIFDGDRLLSKTPLDRALAERLIGQITAYTGCEVLISGARVCYLLSQNEEFIHLVRDLVGYRCEFVRSLDEIPEDIIKVSAYFAPGGAQLLPQFEPEWSRYFNVAVSGPEWLDFTLSDKGTGLTEICRQKGIALSEVMSFGDNYNDLPLLKLVGYPYMMENAAEELKMQFPRHCHRVEDTLAAFLENTAAFV